MSTIHEQPGLSSEQRSTIRSTIREARETLEEELRRRLEFYGVYEDERLELDALGHLSVAERQTRKRIDAAIQREMESTGSDLERSITNYVREATKTHLNRLVALKTVEARGFIAETLTTEPSYGSRSYLHYTVDEIAGELTSAGKDGRGVALDVAYRELGAEIQTVFEESDYTAVDIDPQVRDEVIDLLAEVDDEAWESDEALGWVYQYFGEAERSEIDDRIDEHNYKVAGTDVATKTQLFTPRYIVEWMVDNSLGRMWLEMCGDQTDIDSEDNCFYLAPLEESLLDREPKSVEEITVLDPACGSGHMLFYAFDVLYEMYLEEGDVLEKNIPQSILENNLYGIDIDSGAVQIAALSLYLKAKEREPNVEIRQLNIVSADAVLVNGERKQELLSRADSDLEREIIEQIWRSFDNIREVGSLVQVQERIDELMDEYGVGSDSETEQTMLDTGDGGDSWQDVRERLLDRASKLAREGFEQNDPVEELFADEVGKTVELLDVLIDEYDVVVSNPPYLQSKRMGASLKEHVRSNYTGKYDLYGAFIERCVSFSTDDGYASLITPGNFMFLYYFRGLRKQLLDQTNFVEALHLSDRKEEYMNIATILRPLSGDINPSRFTRVVDYDENAEAARNLTNKIRNKRAHDDVYVFSQSRIDDIGRRPFLYWFGEETLSLFSEYPSLGDIVDLNQGLSTSNDKGLVKKWWELSENLLEDVYVQFQKSGTDSAYYDYPEDYLPWKGRKEQLRENGANFRNQDQYNSRGITFRRFGSYFVGRKLDKDSIFSDKAIFSPVEAFDDEILLGHYNSTLIRYIANGLNPGLNFELGDAARFPIKTKFDEGNEISKLVSCAVEARRSISALTETSADYEGTAVADALEGDDPLSLKLAEEAMEARVLVAHGATDELIFDEYDISPGTRERMYETLPKNTVGFPVAAEAHVEYPDAFDDHVTVERVGNERLDAARRKLEEMDEPTLREAALETELSPLTIAQLRADHDLYSSDERTETAGRVVSLIVGALFGRWETGRDLPRLSNKVLSFGVGDDELRFDVGDDVDELFDDALAALFDDGHAARQALTEALGDDPVDWLRERFFRYHHVDEYKPRGERSPIYWQLESDNGAFSCYLYYHEIDMNTLFSLQGQYLDSLIKKLENERDRLQSQVDNEDTDPELRSGLEAVDDDLAELKEFRETIDEMTEDNVDIDVEDGIWENIKRWDQYQVLETGLPKLKSSYSRD